MLTMGLTLGLSYALSAQEAAYPSQPVRMVVTSLPGGNVASNPGLDYDPLKDFTPITALVTVPTVLVIVPSLPAQKLTEFVALARSKPGQLSFESAGAGSIHHLTMAVFADRAGIDLLHVPYRGGAALVNGLLTGEIQAVGPACQT